MVRRIVKCTKCGQEGHIRTNKKCPMFTQEGLTTTQHVPIHVATPTTSYVTESESESSYDSSDEEQELEEVYGEQLDVDEEFEKEEFYEPTDVEVQAMRDQLSRLSAKHPNVLTDPIDTYHDDLIAQMTPEELQARLKMVRRACNSQMNTMITKNIIRLANNGVGLVSGKGSENLNKTTLNDPILIDTANNYISENVLDLLADEIKLGIIYSSHVANDVLSSPPKENIDNH